jgi:rod shape-determining protein MreD
VLHGRQGQATLASARRGGARSAGAAAMPPMPALDAPPWGAALGALAIALLLQTTLLHGLHVHGGSVSFVLLIVVWFAARAGSMRGAFFGLVAGACEDALSGVTGAAWTVATPLVAALAARTLRAIGSNNPLLFAGAVALASVMRVLGSWFVLRAEGSRIGLNPLSIHGTLWSSALNAAIALVVLLCVPRLRPLRVDRR